MKKKKSFIYITMLIAFFHLHCNDFGDLNVNPNESTFVHTETLITGALGHLDPWRKSFSFLAEDYYVQYFSELYFSNNSIYQTVNHDFNYLFSDALNNLEKVIDLNTDANTKGRVAISGSNNNQIALSKILKTYYYFQMTDRWGALPNSEALNGKENLLPKYDSQQTIYFSIFEELTTAVELIESGEVQGDYLFNGDMSKWEKFAHSIRMIAALRLSKIDPEKGKMEFIQAFDAGVIESNTENILYPYLPEFFNENPFFGDKRFSPQIALSNTLVNRLSDLKDPRLFSFADPAAASGEYIGLSHGIVNPTESSFTVSLPNSTYVAGQTTPYPILTYAQILFSKAEAAHLGWINEHAEQLYYQAIQASMEQWGAFDPTTFESYIAQSDVIWNPNKALQLIGEQKWIALFTQGAEAWAEWRRIGYPELKPAPDATNQSQQIPRRQGYPSSERDTNNENWKEAIDTWLGGVDGLDAQLWWDVQ